MKELVPSHEDYWFRIYGEIAKTGTSQRFEQGAGGLLGGVWYEVYAFRFGRPGDLQVAILFNDISKRKQEEQRKQFLLQLSDSLRPLQAPVAIQEAVTMLAVNYFKSDRCYYCEIDGDKAVIHRDASHGNQPSVEGVYPLDSYPLFNAVIKAGKPFAVEDVRTTDLIDESLKQLCSHFGIIAFINVPVIKNEEAAAIFCITQSTPRNWTNVDIQLGEEIAERTWAAMERAKAEEALHKSEENYRRQLEEQLQNHTTVAQTIVDSSIDQITIFDKSERLLLWNKKTEEATGLKREDVIGKTIREVFPGIVDQPEFLEAQEKAMAGEYVYIPAMRGLYAKNYHQWFYVPLKDEKGETYAVLNIVHDITDKVEAQEQLMQTNRELEAKNEEITRFAFIASHDLKEPIRKIHTFSNWLTQHEADCLSAKGKEYAIKISDAVKRLGILIDDITTLAQVQAVKITPADVNLADVLEEVKADLAEKIKSKNAIITSKELPVVKGIRKQLVQLFRNIISNSLKFQQTKLPPLIKINVTETANVEDLPAGNYLRIDFTDNGIGFEPQFNQKIFRVFQRLHGPSEYPGTGVGLAICKAIMENHGGSIAAEAEPGKGATFTCWFPLQQ